jgi:hypothetical protein
VPTVMSALPVLREVVHGAVRFAPDPLSPDGLAAALSEAVDDRVRPTEAMGTTAVGSSARPSPTVNDGTVPPAPTWRSTTVSSNAAARRQIGLPRYQQHHRWPRLLR